MQPLLCGLPIFQNHELHRLLLSIITCSGVHCYSSRKCTKIVPWRDSLPKKDKCDSKVPKARLASVSEDMVSGQGA
jgi:hypothetical protein